MGRKNKIRFLFVGISLFACNQIYSQTVKPDTVKQVSSIPDTLKVPDLTNTLILDFFTSLDGFSYLNPIQNNQKGNLFLFTSLSINDEAKFKWATLRLSFASEYGIRSYLDSVSQKAADQYEYKIVLEAPLVKSKSIQLLAGLDVKSQFWKSFANDQAGSRVLYSDYFSPGYIIYTGGLSYHFLQSAILDLGFIGFQTTRIKNQRIFEDRNSDELYGIKRGERQATDFGLSVQLTVPPIKFGEHFGWSNTSQVFAPKNQIGRLPGYTLAINNTLHYIFFRYLRLSLENQLIYDERISNKVLLLTHLSLGFYLSNSL